MAQDFDAESLRDELAGIFNDSQQLKNAKRCVKEFMKVYKLWVSVVELMMKFYFIIIKK